MEDVAGNLVRASQWAPRMSGRARQALRDCAFFFTYIILYLAADRLSFIEVLHGIGITPWRPATGLIVALLITKGRRWLPVVFVADVLSGMTLPEVPVPLATVSAAALVVSGGYAGAVAILGPAGFDRNLYRVRDVALLVAVMIVSSGLVACGFVATYAAAQIVPWVGFASAVFHYWVGDAIGIVVLVPPLLVLNRSNSRRVAVGHHRWRLEVTEIGAQAASIVAALAMVFLRVGDDTTKHQRATYY